MVIGCARIQKRRNVSEENILVRFTSLTLDNPLSPCDFCKSCSLIYAGINHTSKRRLDD